jgi:hypothetical protein
MPSLFDDLKKEFGKHAEVFTDKMNEFSETAKGQFEIINLKKDRYLQYKELGERVFELLVNENTSDPGSDVHVKTLVEEITLLNDKIARLEKPNPL